MWQKHAQTMQVGVLQSMANQNMRVPLVQLSSALPISLAVWRNKKWQLHSCRQAMMTRREPRSRQNQVGHCSPPPGSRRLQTKARSRD